VAWYLSLQSEYGAGFADNRKVDPIASFVSLRLGLVPPQDHARSQLLGVGLVARYSLYHQVESVQCAFFLGPYYDCDGDEYLASDHVQGEAYDPTGDSHILQLEGF
jgi:hypothetical protein